MNGYVYGDEGRCERVINVRLMGASADRAWVESFTDACVSNNSDINIRQHSHRPSVYFADPVQNVMSSDEGEGGGDSGCDRSLRAIDVDA